MKAAHVVLVVVVLVVVIFVVSSRVEKYEPTPGMHALPLEVRDQIARIARATATPGTHAIHLDARDQIARIARAAHTARATAAARATPTAEPKRVRFTLPATPPANERRRASESWIARLANTTSKPAQ
jgi:hypothetical protein